MNLVHRNVFFTQYVYSADVPELVVRLIIEWIDDRGGRHILDDVPGYNGKSCSSLLKRVYVIFKLKNQINILGASFNFLFCGQLLCTSVAPRDQIVVDVLWQGPS